MIDVNDFIKEVDQKFWKHIHNNTKIKQVGRKTNRKLFLTTLAEKINNRKYHSQTPRGYINYGKNHYISRIVPSLTIADYCVYYYCLKKIENDLSKTRQEGTFGGFSLGGAIRKSESTEVSSMDDIDISIAISPYNPLAWQKEWGEFQRTTKLYLTKNTNFICKLDIANFYDCINLDRLESKVRLACDASKTDIIDLLFYFLRHWNRDFENYKTKTVGIPQDEVGDCSRILANFYLHEYDFYIKKEAEKSGCKYLRYADDQIFYADTRENAKILLFKSSNFLSKLNLNLNSKKIEFYSKKDFEYYWSYKIYDFFVEPFNKVKMEQGVLLFLKMIKKKKSFRSDTVVKYILYRLAKAKQLKIKIPRTTLDSFLKECQRDDVLLTLKDYQLKALYQLMNRVNQKKFLLQIKRLTQEYLFNNFHYQVLDSKLFESKKDKDGVRTCLIKLDKML